MYEKVRAYIEKYAMLEKNDTVIVGISGGADSICLLFVLLKLQEECHFHIKAVHVNHELRGEEALTDEKFVEALCEKVQVPLKIYRRDVGKLAAEKGISTEEAGREVRREAFFDAMKQYKGTKIALAHHMNDNVETVLFHMLRGTGIKGMAGIRPVNGVYIRPLLCVTRNEIERYLNEKQQTYCIDQSNLEDIYTRNKIRNHVIPYMEKEINEKAVAHIHHLSEQMAELNMYMERQTTEAYRRCVEETDDYRIGIKLLQKEDAVLQSYIIKKVLSKAAGQEKDLEAVHVKLVEKLMRQQTGREISLPYGLTAKRSYDTIIIGKSSSIEKEKEEKPVVKMQIISCEKMPDSFPETLYTKWFDYDIIKNAVVIRHWQPDDYITIDDKGNTQKLKKYFVNAKVPKEEREQILLAADGNHIMWIIGYRQNQAYQVSKKTSRILEIKIERGNDIE